MVCIELGYRPGSVLVVLRQCSVARCSQVCNVGPVHPCHGVATVLRPRCFYNFLFIYSTVRMHTALEP